MLIDLDLPGFLLSCAKKASAGIRPLQAMYASLDPTSAYAERHGVHLPSAASLPLAGLIWHYQMHLLSRIARSGLSGRVRRLAADTFLHAPVPMAQTACDWLGHDRAIRLDPARIAAELQGDAKRPGRAMDAGKRSRQGAQAQAEHQQTIDVALRWCETMFGPWQQAYDTGIEPLQLAAS